MSGIAGILRFDGGPVEPGLVEKMTASMSYRGPDGISHWVQGSVALGQCMLRTTPESLEETQPLLNDDGSLVLVMDGRVDNWEELRTELLARGARLRTRADAELVLRAYEVWGEECLAHIDGDFALVIWNARKREAFCARDRMGHKPFVYHWDGRRLAFASELAALMALPDVPRIVNQGLLAEYMSGAWSTRHETLWRDLVILLPAHAMRLAAAGPRPQGYWSPPLDRDLGYRRDNDYFEHYRAVLEECVRRTARSHVPVGYEVSGGHDSSALFCVAAGLVRAQSLPAPALRAYTLAFHDDVRTNDLQYARSVGAHVGRPIEEVAPLRPPFAWYATAARSSAGLPVFPNAAMSEPLQQRLVADGCRVAISGGGGDEWLSGSPIYYAECLARLDGRRLLQALGADVRDAGVGRTAAAFGRYGMLALLPAGLQEVILQLGRRLLLRPPAELHAFAWLSPSLRTRVTRRHQRAPTVVRSPGRHAGRVALAQAFCDAFSEQAVTSVDGMWARAGAEVRQPMRMRNFVEFACALPAHMRRWQGVDKFVHLRALADLLPPPILARRDKATFNTVVRRPLPLLALQLREAMAQRHPDWLAPGGLDRLLELGLDESAHAWPVSVLWTIALCDLSVRISGCEIGPKSFMEGSAVS